MRASSAEANQLQEDGFLVLKKFVPPGLVGKAKRLVNETLGKQDGDWNKVLAEGKEDAVTDLWNKSGLPEKMKNLMGNYKEDKLPMRFAQVALIFPGHRCEQADDGKSLYKPIDNWQREWHIDGCLNNGEIHAFSALVGVLLQDIEEPMSGELVVFPGAHKNMARLYGQSDAGYDMLLNHNEKAFELAKREQDKESELKENKNTSKRRWNPTHLTGKAGDVVICNFMTPHVVTPNLSSNIRYCVYFRVYSSFLPEEYWNQHRRVAMAIPFHDWSGFLSSCPHRNSKGICTCLEKVRKKDQDDPELAALIKEGRDSNCSIS